jgi:hypothetical protein
MPRSFRTSTFVSSAISSAVSSIVLVVALASPHGADSNAGDPNRSDSQDAPAAGAAQNRTAPTVRVDAADVATVEALVGALYDVISGPAGEKRDWARFHGLFHPELGRMQASRAARESAEGAPTRESVHLSPQDYETRSGPVLESRGFFERELAARVEHFGDIAHVFSTYESRSTPDGEVIARGVNSFQLWWDGTRWWVLSVLWCSESEQFPLDARLLDNPGASDGAK